MLLFTVTILTPRESSVDQSSFFDDRRTRFFSWYASFWVLLGFSQYVLSGEIRPSVVPIALCIIGLFSKSTIVHRALPILMGIGFILIGLVFPESL